MSGVVVTMDLLLKPEAAPHFARMDASGLTGTRSFPGCQGVRIIRHKEEAARFMFIEHWESEEAYHQYIIWRRESGQFQALEAMALTVTVDIWPQTIVQV